MCCVLSTVLHVFGQPDSFFSCLHVHTWWGGGTPRSKTQNTIMQPLANKCYSHVRIHEYKIIGAHSSIQVTLVIAKLVITNFTL
jgi:hypothetical protein